MSATKCLAATILALGLSASAHASGYIGLDGTSLALDTELNEELNPRGVRLRLGMRLDDLFDVEVHLGGATDLHTTAFDQFSTGYAGAFLKAYLPVGQRSALFALAGASGVEITQRINGRDFSDSRTGFSYGIGLETQLSEALDLSADYVRYLGGDGEFSEISAVSLGVKWYF